MFMSTHEKLIVSRPYFNFLETTASLSQLVYAPTTTPTPQPPILSFSCNPPKKQNRPKTKPCLNIRLWWIWRWTLDDLNKVKNSISGAVVVAQLVELSLPMPEVCGSHPVIGKLYITNILLTVMKRGPFFKKITLSACQCLTFQMCVCP